MERRNNYRALFAAHRDGNLAEQIASATKGNYVLGDSRFAQEVEQALGCRAQRGAIGRPRVKEG